VTDPTTINADGYNVADPTTINADGVNVADPTTINTDGVNVTDCTLTTAIIASISIIIIHICYTVEPTTKTTEDSLHGTTHDTTSSSIGITIVNITNPDSTTNGSASHSTDTSSIADEVSSTRSDGVNVADPTTINADGVNVADPTTINADGVNVTDPATINANGVNVADPTTINAYRVNVADPTTINADRLNVADTTTIISITYIFTSSTSNPTTSCTNGSLEDTTYDIYCVNISMTNITDPTTSKTNITNPTTHRTEITNSTTINTSRVNITNPVTISIISTSNFIVYFRVLA
jgi:hypothetical protein